MKNIHSVNQFSGLMRMVKNKWKNVNKHRAHTKLIERRDIKRMHAIGLNFNHCLLVRLMASLCVRHKHI